jgi:hypothetical protein
MKKIIVFIIIAFANIAVYACPECEKQQPKILRGIAHGAGPQSQWDYVIVWAMVGIVLVTLFYSIKNIIKPKESQYTHIKRTILNFE